ncbi:MAG: PadR family transcriptional regulator [Acidobacteria bacterium]|nr:PadR family transcriptional regulator [Acidobacteriota bacterium]
MPAKVNLTYPSALILQVIVNGYQYGFDIMDVTGLPSGTVYPALRRLEQSGLIASQWEAAEIAQQELRPPRKYYGVTPTGEQSLAEAVKRFRLLETMIPNLPRKERPSQG